MKVFFFWIKIEGEKNEKKKEKLSSDISKHVVWFEKEQKQKDKKKTTSEFEFGRLKSFIYTIIIYFMCVLNFMLYSFTHCIHWRQRNSNDSKQRRKQNGNTLKLMNDKRWATSNSFFIVNTRIVNERCKETHSSSHHISTRRS